MNTITPNISILLVEDDKNLGIVIRDNLMEAGFIVTLELDGESAINTFLNENFDVCILDVMLPLKDGFEVAREIRRFSKKVPIIFLTAKSLTEDKIKGFKLGGDDYVTKPFDFEELLVRIQAILSRTIVSDTGKKKKTTLFKLGKYRFDAQNQILIYKSEELKLTRKENGILKLLCLHQDKILTREITLKSVWGNDDYFSGRSMDVFISKLRKYLTNDPTVRIINIHGVGFKLMVKK